jgi:hypothetical protein
MANSGFISLGYHREKLYFTSRHVVDPQHGEITAVGWVRFNKQYSSLSEAFPSHGLEVTVLQHGNSHELSFDHKLTLYLLSSKLSMSPLNHQQLLLSDFFHTQNDHLKQRFPRSSRPHHRYTCLSPQQRLLLSAGRCSSCRTQET